MSILNVKLAINKYKDMGVLINISERKKNMQVAQSLISVILDLYLSLAGLGSTVRFLYVHT